MLPGGICRNKSQLPDQLHSFWHCHEHKSKVLLDKLWNIRQLLCQVWTDILEDESLAKDTLWSTRVVQDRLARVWQLGHSHCWSDKHKWNQQQRVSRGICTRQCIAEMVYGSCVQRLFSHECCLWAKQQTEEKKGNYIFITEASVQILKENVKQRVSAVHRKQKCWTGATPPFQEESTKCGKVYLQQSLGQKEWHFFASAFHFM